VRADVTSSAADAEVLVHTEERLLGEVIVGALQDLVGRNATVALASAPGRVDTGSSPPGLVVDLGLVGISISIDMQNERLGSRWERAFIGVDSLDDLAGLIVSRASVGRPRAGSCDGHPPRKATADRLTDRELEVLGEIRSGADNSTIAAALDISVHTVRSHVGSIMRKLGTSNRVSVISRRS
jgi:DNA-binding CsgD family transcriptional regulator